MSIPRKIRYLAALLLLILLPAAALAAPWDYDFGTGTGEHTSGESESFLPAPQEGGGTARVRAGSGGGGFYLVNPGTAPVGDGSHLRVVASTSDSVNRFSIYEYSPGKTFYTKFKMLLGDSAAGATASAGKFQFFQGAGDRYSSNYSFVSAQVFAGLQWEFSAGGIATTSYRTGSGWTELPGDPFVQGSTFTVEIYGNNTLSEREYSKAGSTYTLAAGTYDLWVNDSQVGDNFTKGELAADTCIESFKFDGRDDNAANLFLDNFEYLNTTNLEAPQSPLSFAAAAQSTTTINWTWQHSSTDTIDGFEIRSSTGGVIVSSTTLTAGTTEYLQGGLTVNASSYYQGIYAVIGSSYSAPTVAEPYPAYAMARVPQNLTALEVNISSVTLSWGENSNPGWTRYGLSYSTDTNFAINVSTPVDFSSALTAATTDVINLTKNTTYYFRVWAYNGNEVMTGFSTPYSTRTEVGRPAPPGDFAGSAVSSTSINWSWSLTDNTTAYYIYDETDTLLQTIYDPTGNWTEQGLNPNIQYTRWIKVGNDYGVSDSSVSAAAYTYAAPPYNLVFNSVNISSMTISWSTSTANPAGTRFGVSYSTASDFSVNVSTPVDFSSALTASTTDILNLDHDTTYYFKVYAFNDAGNWPGTAGYTAAGSTKTAVNPWLVPTAGNLLINEFLEVWTGDTADYWEWGGSAANLTSTTTALVGDYAAWLTEAGDNYFRQTGRTISTGTEHNAEIWVKSSSATVDLAIRYPGGGTSSYGDEVMLKNNEWTKVTLVRTTSDSEGNDGGISMRVKYLGPGASVVVGAAWLGESESPYSWPLDVPLPPADFTPAVESTTTIKWTWTDNSDNEDGFEIRDEAGAVLVASTTLTADTTEYYQDSLTANTSSHYYSIYSVNEEGYSTEFSSSSIFPVYTYARVPQNLTALEVNISSVTLSWGENSNPGWTRYGLSYSTDTNF
ncbi:MAG: fibronectin type III domain-containing protein, partial [Elusimicrobiota bacterium]|nr:fibronectin type III domain-containing protein [Elusimicrobiota bacterium]